MDQLLLAVDRAGYDEALSPTSPQDDPGGSQRLSLAGNRQSDRLAYYDPTSMPRAKAKSGPTRVLGCGPVRSWLGPTTTSGLRRRWLSGRFRVQVRDQQAGCPVYRCWPGVTPAIVLPPGTDTVAVVPDGTVTSTV